MFYGRPPTSDHGPTGNALTSNDWRRSVRVRATAPSRRGLRRPTGAAAAARRVWCVREWTTASPAAPRSTACAGGTAIGPTCSSRSRHLRGSGRATDGVLSPSTSLLDALDARERNYERIDATAALLRRLGDGGRTAAAPRPRPPGPTRCRRFKAPSSPLYFVRRAPRRFAAWMLPRGSPRWRAISPSFYPLSLLPLARALSSIHPLSSSPLLLVLARSAAVSSSIFSAYSLSAIGRRLSFICRRHLVSAGRHSPRRALIAGSSLVGASFPFARSSPPALPGIRASPRARRCRVPGSRFCASHKRREVCVEHEQRRVEGAPGRRHDDLADQRRRDALTVDSMFAGHMFVPRA